ncbi:MAG: hypothetical protein GX855_07945 [Firmicutes bacterium]|nr:hypothetical protein [Bacillota bacterium]
MTTSQRPAAALFIWRPTFDTLVAAGSGLVVLALSAVMGRLTGVNPLAAILVRDVAMVIAAGIFFPLWYIRHRGRQWADLGFHLKGWKLYLALNLVFGGLLWGLLSVSRGPWDIAWDSHTLGCVLYVMLAGIFEVVFFYGFQLHLFEKALGPVMGIVLTAAFYSLHHLGFQREFAKLFLVGIMYGTACRSAKSVLIIYPFFWGVGAVYDVLVQAQAITPIAWPWPRSGLLLVLMYCVFRWGGQRWGWWQPRLKG